MFLNLFYLFVSLLLWGGKFVRGDKRSKETLQCTYTLKHGHGHTNTHIKRIHSPTQILLRSIQTDSIPLSRTVSRQTSPLFSPHPNLSVRLSLSGSTRKPSDSLTISTIPRTKIQDPRGRVSEVSRSSRKVLSFPLCSSL